MDFSLDFSGDFIGTVLDYDVKTRELFLYIPKLMPAISENMTPYSTLTNYGNQNINIPYRESIKIGNGIWVKAKKKSESIPKKGSHVFVDFIDGNPELGVWSPFDMNGDYEIIDEEKYDTLFDITVGERTLSINENDTFELILPDNYSVAYPLSPDRIKEKNCQNNGR